MLQEALSMIRHADTKREPAMPLARAQRARQRYERRASSRAKMGQAAIMLVDALAPHRARMPSSFSFRRDRYDAAASWFDARGRFLPGFYFSPFPPIERRQSAFICADER